MKNAESGHGVRKRDQGPEKVRVAIYARCATSESSKASRKRQEHVCRVYATSFGAGKPLVFADTAGGSSVRDRPGLSALLKKCDRGEVDMIVVEGLDRVSRSITDTVKVVDRLSKTGVKFHGASERCVFGPDNLLCTNRVEKRGGSTRKATGKAGAKKPLSEE
jgi:DNA invertase Pin-like site-specific DNA recombinase